MVWRDKEFDMKRSRKPVSREGVEKLIQVRDQILQEHGGKLFENSIQELHQQREERLQELMERHDKDL